jgi:hypothetical protein
MELIVGGLRGLFGVKSAPTVQSWGYLRVDAYSKSCIPIEYMRIISKLFKGSENSGYIAEINALRVM